MKNLSRYLASLMLIAMAYANAQAQEAFYIYQNDGHFNGFFYDEVQKISYSKLDTLGFEHEDFVSQEIITADSTYRIMLTAIDSVGFQQPAIVYNKRLHRNDYWDLKKTDPSLYEKEFEFWSYTLLESPSKYTWHFLTSMPEQIRPKVGDVFASFDQEYGFAQKVKSVTVVDEETIEVLTKDIDDITDIFQQLITVEEYGQDAEGNTVRRRMAGRPDLTIGETPKKADGHWEGDVFNFSLNGYVPLYDKDDLNISINPSLEGKLHVKTAWNLSWFGEKYIGVSTQLEYGLGLGFKVDGKIKDFFPTGIGKFGSIPVPAACPLFIINLGPDAFLRGEAHLTFNMQSPKIQGSLWSNLEIKNWVPSFEMGFGKPKGEEEKTNQNLNNQGSATFSLNGFVQTGMLFPMTFESLPTIKKFFDSEIGGKWYVGPKVAADFTIDLASYIESINKLSGKLDVAGEGITLGALFYDQLKNTTLQLHLLDADYEVKAKIKTLFSGQKEVTLADGSINVLPPVDVKLVPEFEEGEDSEEERILEDGSKQKCHVISFQPKGYVFNPINIDATIISRVNDDGTDDYSYFNEEEASPVSYYKSVLSWGQELPKEKWVQLVIPYREGRHQSRMSGKFRIRPYVYLFNQSIATSQEYEFEHGAIVNVESDTLFLNSNGTSLKPYEIKGNCDSLTMYQYDWAGSPTEKFPDLLEVKGEKGIFTISASEKFMKRYNPCDTLKMFTNRGDWRDGLPYGGWATINGEIFESYRAKPRYLQVFTLPNTTQNPLVVNLDIGYPIDEPLSIEPIATRTEDGRGWTVSVNYSGRENELDAEFEIWFNSECDNSTGYIYEYGYGDGKVFHVRYKSFKFVHKTYKNDGSLLSKKTSTNTSVKEGYCSPNDDGLSTELTIPLKVVEERSGSQNTNTQNHDCKIKVDFIF